MLIVASTSVTVEILQGVFTLSLSSSMVVVRRYLVRRSESVSQFIIVTDIWRPGRRPTAAGIPFVESPRHVRRLSQAVSPAGCWARC